MTSPARSRGLVGTLGAVAELAGKPDTNRHVSKHRTAGAGRINLKAVGEVLAERGLDPTQALVDILLPTDPETGEPAPCRLPADIQARILNELLQYTQPKLKSIEIKGRLGVAAFNPTDEQARAMAEEFLRAAQDDE